MRNSAEPSIFADLDRAAGDTRHQGRAAGGLLELDVEPGFRKRSGLNAVEHRRDAVVDRRFDVDEGARLRAARQRHGGCRQRGTRQPDEGGA